VLCSGATGHRAGADNLSTAVAVHSRIGGQDVFDWVVTVPETRSSTITIEQYRATGIGVARCLCIRLISLDRGIAISIPSTICDAWTIYVGGY
jgi:hypothetical protein